MSNLFWLTDAQMARLQPFFPKSHGKPRVDDRRVLSGIIFINRNSKVEAIRCLKRYIAREVFGIIMRRHREINQSQIAA
jgi:hypothetical protein